jgi:hypothetical protein
MATEQQISLAAKLYEARAALRFLWGDRYAEELAPWKEMLGKIRIDRQLDTLPAAFLMISELDKKHLGNSSSRLAVLAAAVELIEPTEPPSTSGFPA